MYSKEMECHIDETAGIITFINCVLAVISVVTHARERTIKARCILPVKTTNKSNGTVATKRSPVAAGAFLHFFGYNQLTMNTATRFATISIVVMKVAKLGDTP